MNESFIRVDDAIDWIHGKRYKGEKNGLENMKLLMDRLDHPERKLRMIHVAGTNGKGSVCAFCERTLRESGLKTGLYTSPYLVTYNERIRVNGIPIGDGDLMRLSDKVRSVCDALNAEKVYPTAFEIGTAIAFLYFEEQKTNIAVIETGLGGRLDSTNVITPVLSVITAIGYDHTHILGSTLPEISLEKAGIIKSGVPCVVMRQPDEILNVFRKRSGELSSPLLIAEPPVLLGSDRSGSRFRITEGENKGKEFSIGIPGEYQMRNASTAIMALEVLGLPEETIRRGLSLTKWPCRLEWCGNILIDGGHNPQGMGVLVDYIDTCLKNEKISLVFAMMKDKDIRTCASLISGRVDRIYTASVGEARSASPEELAALCGGNVTAEASVEDALAKARSDGSTVVICAGSLYLAGRVRNILIGRDGSI